MPAGRRRKTRYSNPAKGTKTRAAVNLMLRREGATSREVGEQTGLTRDIGGILERLRKDCGFDIAVFPVPAKTKPINRYKIIGRYRWDGSYRSFVSTNWE